MKTTNCERCWKKIEYRPRRKYCIQCRKEVDQELANVYIEKHYRGGTRRKNVE